MNIFHRDGRLLINVPDGWDPITEDSALLAGADLAGADLQCVDLLSGSDLRRSAIGMATRIEGADLRGANLSGALLEGALYDPLTTFPDDFDPVAHGLTFRETKFVLL